MQDEVGDEAVTEGASFSRGESFEIRGGLGIRLWLESELTGRLGQPLSLSLSPIKDELTEFELPALMEPADSVLQRLEWSRLSVEQRLEKFVMLFLGVMTAPSDSLTMGMILSAFEVALAFLFLFEDPRRLRLFLGGSAGGADGMLREDSSERASKKLF